jgi:hypothetical protein
LLFIQEINLIVLVEDFQPVKAAKTDKTPQKNVNNEILERGDIVFTCKSSHRNQNVNRNPIE